MKYNPKFCDAIAGDPGLNAVHPGAPASLSQGWLEILATLEDKLCAITGMSAAHAATGGGRGGRTDRTLAHAGVSRIQWRRSPPCDYSRFGARHEPPRR